MSNELTATIAESSGPLITADAAGKLLAVLQPIADRIDSHVFAVADTHITTVEENNAAAQLLATIRADCKTALAAIKEHKDAAKRRHSQWCALEDGFTNRLSKADSDLKSKIGQFQAEQRRIAEAEQRRLQAIADEAARKERERLEREAAKLKTPEKREERLEAAAAVVAPVVHIEPPKSGVRFQKHWQCEIESMQEFLEYAIARVDLQGAIEVKVSKLVAIKRALPDTEIPGVRFWQEER